MERLRQVLALAFPVDVGLLAGALADFGQVIKAVVQRPDMPGEAAELLSESVSRLEKLIEEIHGMAPNPGP